MGWQSYIIDVNSIRKRTETPEAMEKHNNKEDFELVGEEIVGICYATNKETKRLNILFANGGGRGSTFAFFKNYGVEAYDRTRGGRRCVRGD
jgi:hypothetical protein